MIAALAEAHDGLLQSLRRDLRSREDAEDVMQQIYVRVLERAHQVRREESVRTWLRRVLRSVLNDHLRRQRGRRRAEADFARKDVATPPAETDDDATVCLCLYQVVPALRTEYADVLRRLDLDGEPRATVAFALGLTPNALAVRLHRAREALRRVLELTCETCPIHGYRDCGCDYTRRLLALRPDLRKRAAGL